LTEKRKWYPLPFYRHYPLRHREKYLQECMQN